MRIHLGLQSCCLLRLPRGLKHLGDVLVDLLPHALAVILLRLSIFLELLLSLLVTLLALLFSLLPLLVFLRPNLLLPGRLSFPVWRSTPASSSMSSASLQQLRPGSWTSGAFA